MTQELPTSIKQVMDAMPGAFQPDKAAGVDATIQFNFTGDEPGNYTVKVADGACAVNDGTDEGATVTINAPSDVWLKIMRQELDGSTAFMSGQFTFTGDMGVLMQMQTWFAQG